ncbi:MAG: DNA double-strand break repair nuclease NurA [Peptoniphilaceae bacterium]
MNDFNEMKEDIKELNYLLKNKYNKFFSMPRESFRVEVLNEIGKFSSLEKLSNKKLKEFGLVVGVDGSVNKVGGSYPHYIELYQALAKPTIGEDLFSNSYYSPMLSGNTSEDEKLEINKREKLLASIELDVAIKSVKYHKPSILMMDGGLIRYKIHDQYNYEELISLCEKNSVVIVGVIKDLKTNVISRTLNEDLSLYDRELLYGKLNKGDFIEIKDEYNKKSEEKDSDEGLVSAFLNTSSSAMAIGLDLIKSQREYIKDVANLVYTLTPNNSRGVPLWLDIVDNEVKITDLMIESMLEEYLDRDIYERFFVSERDRRGI